MTMIAHVYFSLFSSPTQAYANVSGDLEIKSPVEVGAHIAVLLSKERDCSVYSLKIQSVTSADGKEKQMLGLEDVIAESLEDASQLGKRFETEAGLFCDVYD
jgi:hypothetical protein